MYVDKPEQVSLLKAEVAFARKTSGVLAPFRYLGIAPKVEFSAMGDDIEEITDPRQVSSAPYKRIRRKRVPEFSLGLKAVNPDNLALIYAGTVADYTQAATPITDEVLTGTLKVGAIFKLAKVKLTSVEELATADDVVADPDTDYAVNLDAGTIEILAIPDGASEGDAMKASYTPTEILTAAALKQVKAATEARVEGRLLLRGLSADGERRLVTIWSVDLGMDGSLPFVTENSSEFGLKVTVLTDAAHEELWEDLQLAAPTP